jgi:hypothetical protein
MNENYKMTTVLVISVAVVLIALISGITINEIHKRNVMVELSKESNSPMEAFCAIELSSNSNASLVMMCSDIQPVYAE